MLLNSCDMESLSFVGNISTIIASKWKKSLKGPIFSGDIIQGSTSARGGVGRVGKKYPKPRSWQIS